MLKNQHNYIRKKLNYYRSIIISLLLIASNSIINSSEINSNEEKEINNTPDKPSNIVGNQSNHLSSIENHPQITPIIPIKQHRNSNQFKNRLAALLKHSRYPFLFGTDHNSFGDNLLIQSLDDLHIDNLQKFLRDMGSSNSKILAKMKNFPSLKQLTLFIADNWYLLENTNQILEGVIAQKYQLMEEDISCLRRDLYGVLADLLYLPKKGNFFPCAIQGKLRRAQQELFSILKFLEQLYCAVGAYDTCMTQAIVEGIVTTDFSSIKKALINQNKIPLASYYQHNKEAFKRISKLTHINHLPTLSCKNYLNVSFTRNLTEELSLVYHTLIHCKYINEISEVDIAKLINILGDNFVSEEDIDETLDNLNNINNPDNIHDYLDENEQIFCKKEDIKYCIEGYKKRLTSYRLLANQIDYYLYSITSNEKYNAGNTIPFFQKTKSFYLIRYFKNLLSKKKILSKYNIDQEYSFFNEPLQKQFRAVIGYSLDIKTNQQLQELIFKEYQLSDKEQEIIRKYTAYEACSTAFQGITNFRFPKLLSPSLKEAWKQYIITSNWLVMLTSVWFNMQYAYNPDIFFPLIKNQNIMQKLATTPLSYQNLKKLFANQFDTIKATYDNTPNNNKMYILTGISQILVDRNQNYLTKEKVTVPFLKEYHSIESYFQHNHQRIACLIIKIIFPNTYHKVIERIYLQDYLGLEKLYNLRKDIQRKKSNLLTKQFITSLSQQENAQEEIVKRINLYIETMLLFKSMIFLINQYFNSNQSTNEIEISTDFSKQRIEVFKQTMKSILRVARTSKKPLAVLEQPLQFMIDDPQCGQLNLPNMILNNLDLLCYQEMLVVILQMNRLEKLQNKFWDIIQKLITRRTAKKNIMAILQNRIYEVKAQQVSKMSKSYSTDEKILSQYLILVHQYLTLLNLLQLSSIPKNRLIRVIVPILKNVGKQFANKNPNSLVVQQILSMNNIKLIMNKKDSLKLALSQNDWRRLKNIIAKEKNPAQFLVVPMVEIKNQGNIQKQQRLARNLNGRSSILAINGYTSKEIERYAVDFTYFVARAEKYYHQEVESLMEMAHDDNTSKLYKFITYMLQGFGHLHFYTLLHRDQKHLVCDGLRSTIHMVNALKNQYCSSYTPIMYNQKWIKNHAELCVKILEKKEKNLHSCMLQTHYWWQNKTYFAIWYLVVKNLKQSVLIQSFNMDNTLLNNYSLNMYTTDPTLYIKTLDQQYFIIGVVQHGSATGKIYFFKKNKPNWLYSLKNVKFLNHINDWAYSSKTNVLFITLSEGFISAYHLSNEKLEQVNQPKQIKGNKVLISPKNHTEKGCVLLAVSIENQQSYYSVYQYKLYITDDNQVTIQKVQKNKHFLIPISKYRSDVDKSNEVFKIFCSPKQINYLFILTLEQLLVINTKTWKVESMIPIFQISKSIHLYTSDDGIAISSAKQKSVYSLTWEELAKITNKNNIE